VAFTEYRIALYAAYIGLVLWKYHRGTEADLWLWFLGYVALNVASRAAEGLVVRYRERANVSYMRSLDPTRQAELIAKMWLSVDRKFFRERLAAEGAPERDGPVERFPFGHSDRRENTILFWVTVLVAGAVLVVLFRFRAVPTWLAWLLWSFEATCLMALAWLRRREQHLRTLLEVSPFAVSEVAPDGSRRTIRWSQRLFLRNRPRVRRAELYAAGEPGFIALDYARLGFERIANLVIQYGGFPK